MLIWMSLALTPASSVCQVSSRNSKHTKDGQKGCCARGDAKSPTPGWGPELGRDRDIHGGWMQRGFLCLLDSPYSQPPLEPLTPEGATHLS